MAHSVMVQGLVEITVLVLVTKQITLITYPNSHIREIIKNFPYGFPLLPVSIAGAVEYVNSILCDSLSA